MAVVTLYTEDVIIMGTALASPQGVPGQPFAISSPGLAGSSPDSVYVTIRYADGNQRVIAAPVAEAGNFVLGAKLSLVLNSGS